MSKKKLTNFYSRKIMFPPGLGDWTALSGKEHEDEHAIIRDGNSSSFDSLSENKLSQLHIQHYKLGETLLEKLSSSTKSNIKLKSVTVTQYPFENFHQDFNTPHVQINLQLRTLGTLHLLLPTEFASPLITRLSGGTNLTEYNSTFTKLDKLLLKTQITELLPCFSESWNHIFSSSDLSMEILYDTYTLQQKVSPSDLLTSFEIKFDFENTGDQKIYIAYSNKLLKPLLQFHKKTVTRQTQNVRLSQKTTQNLKIPIIATLGKTKLVLHDILNLQSGDIVMLDNSINDPVNIKIGDNVLLNGQTGKVKNKLCIQLLSPPKEHEKISIEPSTETLFPEEETILDIDTSTEHPVTQAHPAPKTELTETTPPDTITAAIPPSEELEAATTLPENTIEDTHDTFEETEENDLDLEDTDLNLDEEVLDEEINLDELDDNNVNDTTISDTINTDMIETPIEDTESLGPIAENEHNTQDELSDSNSDTMDLDDIDDDDFSWDDLDEI